MDPNDSPFKPLMPRPNFSQERVFTGLALQEVL